MSMRQFVLATSIYLAFWVSAMAYLGSVLRTERPTTSTPRVINQR